MDKDQQEYLDKLIKNQAALIVLRNALEGLNGIPIPFNIIKHQIMPLRSWLDYTLKEQPPQAAEHGK